MNADTHALSPTQVETAAVTPPAVPWPRQFMWSLRRELWENRAVFIAPLVTAVILHLGLIVSAARLPHARRHTLLLDPAQRQIHIERPYDFITSILLLVAFFVWWFYCLDALYGERRDRTILFWKSLPVSDLTTVLSKAVIPLVVLPAISFVLIVLTQLDMWLISAAVLKVSGLPATTADQLPLLQVWGSLAYGLVAMVLWDAPLFAWLLVVSVSVKRAPFLWALLPPLALVALERIAFQTLFFGRFLLYRAMGWTHEAFAHAPRGQLVIDPLNPIAPVKYLSNPNLWLGLVAAVVLLAAAARLRRYRTPL